MEQTRAIKLLEYFDSIVAAYNHQPVFQPELTEELRTLLWSYDSDLDSAYEQGRIDENDDYA